MAVNKVVYGTETLIDLTSDTATASDVAEGKYFHLASGVRTVGTASGGGSMAQKSFYGTCATAAAMAAKVVECSDFTLSDYDDNPIIFVKFTNAQTYNGGVTLNVNGTGAKAVARVGTTITGERYYWLAGELCGFVYDGTNWTMLEAGLATTTYYGVTKLSSSTSSTSTTLAATPSAVKTAYDLADSKATVTTTTVTIAVADWSSLTAAKSVTGVTASNTVICSYAPASKSVYIAADVYCYSQASGTLTFKCAIVPTAAVTVNIMIID